MLMVLCRKLLTALLMLPPGLVAASLMLRNGQDGSLLAWIKGAAENAHMKDQTAIILGHMNVDSLVNMFANLKLAWSREARVARPGWSVSTWHPIPDGNGVARPGQALSIRTISD